MNREQLISKLVTILKDIDGSDLVSDDKYYITKAEEIIMLCGGYYDYCELMEDNDTISTNTKTRYADNTTQ